MYISRSFIKSDSLSTSMQQSTKNDIIELTDEVISQSRLSNVPVQNNSDSIPEPVGGDIGNNNVLSIWKTIDSIK